MGQEAKFTYYRSVGIGKYIIHASIVGPLPQSNNYIGPENTEVTVVTYLREQNRKPQFVEGVPARMCDEEEHNKIMDYLNAEGFIDNLCHQFRVDWVDMKELKAFEEREADLEDINNVNTAFDLAASELYDPTLNGLPPSGPPDEDGFVGGKFF